MSEMQGNNHFSDASSLDGMLNRIVNGDDPEEDIVTTLRADGTKSLEIVKTVDYEETRAFDEYGNFCGRLRRSRQGFESEQFLQDGTVIVETDSTDAYTRKETRPDGSSTESAQYKKKGLSVRIEKDRIGCIRQIIDDTRVCIHETLNEHGMLIQRDNFEKRTGVITRTNLDAYGNEIHQQIRQRLAVAN